jgi:hypothetical protein
MLCQLVACWQLLPALLGSSILKGTLRERQDLKTVDDFPTAEALRAAPGRDVLSL